MADLYTIETLARDCGVHTKVILKWIKKGELPASNLGSWLFPKYVMTKSDVFSFFKDHHCKYTKRKQDRDSMSASERSPGHHPSD
jgi:hypothetical protein